MKISYASDLHLEFHTVELRNVDKSDVLVLAGDIMVAEDVKKYPFCRNDPLINSASQNRSKQYEEFFRICASEWENVVYVAGNHEHYEGVYNRTHTIIDENLAALAPNIFYLNSGCVAIGGKLFVGSTIWTDLNKQDSLTKFHLSEMMNDYKRIRFRRTSDAYRKLRPEDTLHEHMDALCYFKFLFSENREMDVIVVTHHAPTYASVPPHFKGDFLMNGGYCSDLSDLILDNENIKVWFHGHIHDENDYMVGNTRVLCNPRGYSKYEQRANDFQLKTIEV